MIRALKTCQIKIGGMSVTVVIDPDIPKGELWTLNGQGELIGKIVNLGVAPSVIENEPPAEGYNPPPVANVVKPQPTPTPPKKGGQ